MQKGAIEQSNWEVAFGPHLAWLRYWAVRTLAGTAAAHVYIARCLAAALGTFLGGLLRGQRHLALFQASLI